MMNFKEWNDYGTHNESPCRDMYEDWEQEREKLIEIMGEIDRWAHGGRPKDARMFDRLHALLQEQKEGG